MRTTSHVDFAPRHLRPRAATVAMLTPPSPGRGLTGAPGRRAPGCGVRIERLSFERAHTGLPGTRGPLKLRALRRHILALMGEDTFEVSNFQCFFPPASYPPGLSCDIHTHPPARKVSQNLKLCQFLLNKHALQTILGMGHGHACRSSRPWRRALPRP